MKKQFGGKLTGEWLQKYSASPNWRDDKFENLEETKMEMSLGKIPKLLYRQIFKTTGRTPARKIPIAPFHMESFLSPSAMAKWIWYGHSVLLLRLNGKTILIDPMLGNNAAPIAPFSVTRFSTDALSLIDQFPEIDLVMLSHDHYDHLDLDSIQKLIGKSKQYFVALGVGRHLESWGIEPDKITEFDWWDQQFFNDISITFTPTRHFSGRGLKDRFKSLWGGWVLRNEKENLFFSGDSGYGNHFIEVGKRLGPFDFGWMECGQYNENWHQIHMFPEESVQAAIDTGVKKAMPVHWAGFSLSLHHWTDPVERFIRSSNEHELEWTVPRIGELASATLIQQESWWKEYA